MDRRVLGSWLQGPGAVIGAEGYRGERLGLPEEGPASLAGIGRRLAALAVDWVTSMLVAGLFVPFGDDAYGLVTLAVFGAQVLVGTVLGGASFGHRLLRLQVRRLDTGATPGAGRALVRTALLCLAVPALIWDRDGRGLHDKAAGTALLRR